jgi:hypothetical protein
MVFFICEACQESLKKKQVDIHRCNSYFTCVDCSHTFDRQSYKLHDT